MIVKTAIPMQELVTTRDGIKIPFIERGAKDGIPIVLLHGYTDSCRSWQLVLPHLPFWIRAIAVSQRGHGMASTPQFGFGPQQLAGDIAAFMDELGIDRAILVGHSMGSIVAQYFAASYPDRALAMMLVGALRTYRGNSYIEKFARAVAAIQDRASGEFVRQFQRVTLGQPVPEDFFRDVIEDSLAVHGHVWRESMADFLAAPPADCHNTPTFIAWGDQDRICSYSDQIALVRSLWDVHLSIYPGCGNGLHWEQPKRFAMDLESFSNRIALKVQPIRRIA